MPASSQTPMMSPSRVPMTWDWPMISATSVQSMLNPAQSEDGTLMKHRPKKSPKPVQSMLKSAAEMEMQSVRQAPLVSPTTAVAKETKWEKAPKPVQTMSSPVVDAVRGDPSPRQMALTVEAWMVKTILGRARDASRWKVKQPTELLGEPSMYAS